MGKLHFKYATMNSGKSIDLIRTAYNYEENGFNSLVIKPLIDTKGSEYITSRIGIKKRTDILINSDNSFFTELKNKLNNIKVILVDEAQFLTERQVDELFIISKAIDIDVICYGLRVDFLMNSFNGSRRLLEIADTLEECRTICKCGKIARYAGRKLDGEYQLEGEKVVIDGTDNYEYVPLCGECYLKEVKKLDLKSYVKKLR